MKTILVFCIGMAGLAPVWAGGKPELDGDKILLEIRSQLPGGWTMRIENDRLILERAGDVWVLAENQINAPLSRESETERGLRIKTGGIKTATRLEYRLEPRWSVTKRTETETHNRQIRIESDGLRTKYGLEHLFDARLSAKGGEYFKPGTPEEELRIKAYRDEQSALAEKIVLLPIFDSEKYSFFFERMSGTGDEYHLVFPEQASAEAYRIMNQLAVADK